ncbi:hypothetical protein [Sphingopyxis kveilinensis]|uniref:hypothetical protein n=1 Tax=Sphingopyxis kveilinensis TaxID=3114367 RepID=UPI0030D5A9BE
MIPGAGLGALLLLAAPASPAAAAGGAPAARIAEIAFAPPVGQPMHYRVTTRRIGREGSLIDFAITYDLKWERAGRGYRLDAVLRRIESDAPPAVTRALTMMLDPLVGADVAYMVAADGNRIDMIDPDRLWERVLARVEAAGAEGERAQAQQLAAMIAALPAADRDQLASADIRTLLAPANGEIPAATGADVSIRQDGAIRTVAKSARTSMTVGGVERALVIDDLWTIDTATGLVVRERQQSWLIDADGGGRTLVEERIRALEPGL